MKTKLLYGIFLMTICFFHGEVNGQASTQGSWTPPVNVGTEGIHSGVFHTGDVIYYPFRTNEVGSTTPPAYIFNPNNPTNGLTRPTTNTNFFCAGMTMLADGRYLMNGGVDDNAIQGIIDNWAYNPITHQWEVLASMNKKRWYPSTIMLGNGMLFNIGGTSPDTVCAMNAEIYDPTTNTWTNLNNGNNIPSFEQEEWTVYPRIHLLPDNPGAGIYRILQTGTFADTRIWEVNTNNFTISLAPTQPGQWANLPEFDPNPCVGAGGQPSRIRYYNLSVQLQDGRYMVIDGLHGITDPGGGERPQILNFKGTDFLDLTQPSPQWVAGPVKPGSETQYQDAVLLPDGQVLVVGGGAGATEAIFNPGSNSWSTISQMTVNREYHSSASLLADGRVLMSGGENAGIYSGPGLGAESSHIEIYSPPYLHNGARPVISSAPTTASYGQNLNVPYTSTGGSITKVVIHRPGDYTHCFSYNMISEPVNFVDNGSSLTVTVPSNPNVIPPGYYLLFILSNNGGVEVPSVGQWINISDSGPPVDTNPPSQPSIASFSGVTENSITVNSTVSTDPEGSNPVQYQFDETSGNAGGTDSGWQNSTSYTDNGLSASTQYCYRVRSRDSAGTPNVTGYSSTSCQTTNAAADTNPPTPNPMTFASSPSAIGDAVITMTATTASDPTPVIEYLFDETSGNTGGTDSGWQVSTLYYDLELNAGTQYCYTVQARDGLGNTGAASSVSCVSTAVEDGFIDVSVGPGLTFNPANITINVGDTVEWTFIDAGHNVWAGQSGAHNFFINNPAQILFASSADPTTTNPSGFVYAATFDQAFLDNSTGDGTSANIYNYHCHIHTSIQMSGQITINGGVDTAAPFPNPMTFASAPVASSSSAIDMTATTALDGQSSPVQYFFDETSGNAGGSDSLWQSSASYTDTGLTANTQYCYTVAARDSLGNATTASTASCATTQSVPTCGSGQPYTNFVGAGQNQDVVATASSVDETATAAKTVDGSGLTGNVHDGAWNNGLQAPSASANPNPARGNSFWVRYDLGHLYTLGVMDVWNHNESGVTNRGFNSVSIDYSQDGTNWTALGNFTFPQAPGTGGYTGFTGPDFGGVCARYVIITSNTNHGGGFSHSLGEVKFNLAASAPPDTTAPTPNPATFASAPAATSSTAIAMTATTASDPSTPVEYNFDNTSGTPGGTDSGWQTSTSYTDLGLSPSTQYCYTVQSRDGLGNTGTASAASCATTQAPPDTTPPTPNPATFASAPAASSATVINMTATTASDPSGPVEYFFNHVSGTPGGTDSSWQTSTSYSDSGLAGSTQYCYTVQSRDSAGNTTTASAQACATTQTAPDTTPPTPNPATFVSAPASTGTSSVAMTATTGSDPSGPVEYFFTETTANPGGSNSTWQTSTGYTDTLLSPSTQYCYTVTSRDSVGNTGSASAASCATTDALPDTTPPTPNPATFASAPAAISSSAISMTATTASDPSGPVEYSFVNTSGGTGGTNSGWQTSASYTDSGLQASTQYCYTVQSRDSVGNTGTASAASCATTQAGGGSWTKFDGNVANYTGTWETVTAYPAAYQGTTQWGLTGSFTYNFTGTGIRIFTWDCDGGTINLTIDGQSVGSINTTGNCATSVQKYENISLSPGSHTLVGTISSGEVEIDAFEVFN